MRELVRALALICLIVELQPEHVQRVIDGDTFVLYDVDVPPESRVRVLGVNTPERGDPRYKAAGEFTRAWLKRGPFIMKTCERDSLLRRLAWIERNGVRLDTELTMAGYHVPNKYPAPGQESR